ncbi:MAG: AraC family transcriptional regulator, partial [Gemmatimonadetes bacterium]|nr:AraC family transcriptional regulator [Gemmatimonadota bacterium]
FHRPKDVHEALRFGYPRLLVCRAEDQRKLRRRLPACEPPVPVLAMGEPTLRTWEDAWEADGLAHSRIDDSALRLRALMEKAAVESDWVDGVYSDLTQAVGRGLPGELRGFSRRILESPFRYSSLSSLAEVFAISPGALKARFRRRRLPSPSRYMRWFRLLSAARILSDPRETTLTASYRLGFASDGNFCRWVRATSGLTPSAIRGWNGRLLLLTRMAEDCLHPRSLDAWELFGGLFLRQVA